MGEVIRLSLSDHDQLRKSLRDLVYSLNEGRKVLVPHRQALDELAVALNDAASRGETELFASLAKQSGNLKSRSRDPSLLLWAAVEGHAEIVNALLAVGADPNEELFSIPVLAMSARQGHLEVVQQLLDAGASVTTDSRSVDALTYAVKSQNVEVVDLLIKVGADLCAKTIAGSPLQQAVKLGNSPMAERLIAAGADVHMTWTAGNNLIADAIENVSIQEDLGDEHLSGVIQLLVEHGVDVNAKNVLGRTPLMLAVEANRQPTVELLLSLGADPNITSHSPDPAKDQGPFSSVDHATALILAARAGNAKITSVLLTAGAALESTDKTDLTALRWAKRNGHADVVEVLMAAGAETDESSPQALLSAAREGDLVAVQRAIEKGADVNALDEVGSLDEELIGPTPLILAAAGGHGKVVAELVRGGANIELQSRAFPTSINPLMAAAERGRTNVMEQLLAAGADVNAKNKGFEGGRMQPLHFAAEGGQAQAVKLLLEHGAKVKARNAEKETPLHLAVSSGDLETVRLLLDAGADPQAKNEFGNTPRDGLRYAKKKNSKLGPLLQAAETAAPKKSPIVKKRKSAPAIPHSWEESPWEIDRPDFSTAATTKKFQQAIAYASDRLGVEPNAQDELPGVTLFEMTRGKASYFANEHRDELAQLGAMAVFGLGRFVVRDEDPDPGLFTSLLLESVGMGNLCGAIFAASVRAQRPLSPGGPCCGVMFEEETEKRNSEESTSQNQR